MKTADDISTENPEIVDVFRNGAARKLELDQVIDEGASTAPAQLRIYLRSFAW